MKRLGALFRAATWPKRRGEGARFFRAGELQKLTLPPRTKLRARRQSTQLAEPVRRPVRCALSSLSRLSDSTGRLGPRSRLPRGARGYQLAPPLTAGT